MIEVPCEDDRETRWASSEIKFVVDASRARAIRKWARAELSPDPHGTGEAGDEYLTTTLYFDTTAHDVLYRRGSYGRAKYRVRRYGDETVVFLERKLRRGSLLCKRRTVVAIDTIERLDGPVFHDGWAGAWFERRVRTRVFSPVCQISYRRTARCGLVDGRVARLTIDAHARAARIDRMAFVRREDVEICEGREILEMKFVGALPAVFARAVHEFGLMPLAVSKYRLGMAALGHPSVAVGAGAEPAFGRDSRG